jgi:hypothetical protein
MLTFIPLPNLHASVRARSSACCAEQCSGKGCSINTVLSVETIPNPAYFFPVSLTYKCRAINKESNIRELRRFIIKVRSSLGITLDLISCVALHLPERRAVVLG